MARTTRRQFLRLGGALASALLTVPCTLERALAQVAHGAGPYGPLGPPDDQGIQLPTGFRSRVIARFGEPVAGSAYPWHRFPDGGATFPLRDRGWVYVSNSECFIQGGVGAIRFDADGRIRDAYSICSGTLVNCAGGATPWGTWLTCEEFSGGNVLECDPLGRFTARRRLALGTFQHEAAAVDPVSGIVYLTEDVPDGGFYRFVPNARGNLESGVLQVAAVSFQGQVRWHDVPEPNPGFFDTPTRHQVPGSTPFRGGEGIVWSRHAVYFTTKLDNRVWVYVPGRERMGVLYQDDAPLQGVDNLAAAHAGDLLVAEDGGNMELVLITPRLEVAPLLRVLGQPTSELAGPAFDPSGRRLYVSSQRGDRFGITYEITGPFRRGAPKRGHALRP